MFVDEVVVFGAQQAEVVEIGGAVLRPPGDVVDLAPFGGGGAADAAAVAGGDGGSLGGGGEALCAAQPERLGVRVEDGGEEFGVAGQLGDRFGGQRGAVGQRSPGESLTGAS